MSERKLRSLVAFGALSLWLGAAAFFAFGVAPAMFAIMPSRTLAGGIVARLLPTIYYAGMLVGAIVLSLELLGAQERHPLRPRRAGAALGIVAACAFGQFVIGARIARLREEIGGTFDTLVPADTRRIVFGRLHGASVGALGIAMLAALIAVVLIGRDLAADDDRA